MAHHLTGGFTLRGGGRFVVLRRVLVAARRRPFRCARPRAATRPRATAPRPRRTDGAGDGGAGHEFDVVVIGGGAVGENVADRAGRPGWRRAGRARPGGRRVLVLGLHALKALLRPGAALAAARGVPGRGRRRRRATWTSQPRSRGATRSPTDGTTVAGRVGGGRGDHAAARPRRFTGPRALEVDGRRDRAPRPPRGRRRHRVRAVVPDVDGPADAAAVDQPRGDVGAQVPARLAVLGGGVVGVEMATAFADFGSEVTLVVRGDRLLTGPSRSPARRSPTALTELGVTVLFGAEAQSARRDADGVHLHARHRRGRSSSTRSSSRPAADRGPPTSGSRRSGLEPGTAIDGRRRPAGRPASDGGWLFAVGDVSGRTATTHQGKYDARVVATSSRPGSTRGLRGGLPEGATAGDRALSPTTSARPHRGAATGRPPTSPPCRRSCSPAPRSPGSG